MNILLLVGFRVVDPEAMSIYRELAMEIKLADNDQHGEHRTRLTMDEFKLCCRILDQNIIAVTITSLIFGRCV